MFASKSFGWLSGSLAAVAEKTDCRSALFLALLSLASHLARSIAFSSFHLLMRFFSFILAISSLSCGLFLISTKAALCISKIQIGFLQSQLTAAKVIRERKLDADDETRAASRRDRKISQTIAPELEYSAEAKIEA